MRRLEVSIFRASLAREFRALDDSPLVVTRQGRPVACVLSPASLRRSITAIADADRALHAVVSLLEARWCPGHPPPSGRTGPGACCAPEALAKVVHPYGAPLAGIIPRSPSRTIAPADAVWTTPLELAALRRGTPSALAVPSRPLWITGDAVTRLRAASLDVRRRLLRSFEAAATGLHGRSIAPAVHVAEVGGFSCVAIRRAGAAHILDVAENERAPTEVGARTVLRRRRRHSAEG